jgi:hypothetical protein
VTQKKPGKLRKLEDPRGPDEQDTVNTFSAATCRHHAPVACSSPVPSKKVTCNKPRWNKHATHWANQGRSEPAATNAPVQDEAVQAILGMNQKHILFPCPGIFQPPYLPKNFPLLPTFTPLLPTSYLFHLIYHSLHLQSSGELPTLSSTELRKDVDTRLEEGGEEKARGALHPKCKSERRKVSSLLSLHFFFFYAFFFICFFFFFLLFEKKKMPRESA